MPRDKYKVITVKKETYDKAQSQASKEKTSISKIVTKALQEYIKNHQAD